AGRDGHDLDQVRHARLVVAAAYLGARVGDGALHLPAHDVGRVEQQQRALRRPAGGRHLPRRLLQVHDARAYLRVDALRDGERVAEARIEPLGDVARELEVLALVV